MKIASFLKYKILHVIPEWKHFILVGFLRKHERRPNTSKQGSKREKGRLIGDEVAMVTAHMTGRKYVSYVNVLSVNVTEISYGFKILS